MSPPLQLSALKKKGQTDTAILRFWNPSHEETMGIIDLAGLVAQKVWRCDLAERRGKALRLEDDQTLRLGVRGGEIVTLEIL